MDIKYLIREKGKHWKYSVHYEYLPEEEAVGAWVRDDNRRLIGKLYDLGVTNEEFHRFILLKEYLSRWGWCSRSSIEVDEQDIPRIKEVLGLLRKVYDETLEEALRNKPYYCVFDFDPDPATLREIEQFFKEKNLQLTTNYLIKLKIDKKWGFEPAETEVIVAKELKAMNLSKAPSFKSNSLRFDFWGNAYSEISVPYAKIESEVERIIKEDMPEFLKHFATVIHNSVTFQPINIQDSIVLGQEQKEMLMLKGDSEPLCLIKYMIKQETFYDGQPTIEAALDLSDDEFEWLEGRTIHTFSDSENLIKPLNFSGSHLEIPIKVKVSTCPEVMIAFLKAYQGKVVKAISEHAPTEKKPSRRNVSGNLAMSPETKEKLAPLLIEMRLTG